MMNAYKNYDLDNLDRACVPEVAKLARKAGTEGAVLLKNDGVLPFNKGLKLSVFGRTQIDYVKSGTGSGGLVRTEYNINVIDGLRGRIAINEALLSVYTEWLKDNPFDAGHGWATEPWSQQEMPVSDSLCAQAARESDAAVVVIGRTAGEDRDNENQKGSYLLFDEEEAMIATVCKHFKRVCVVLNTGNIIDMRWVDKYSVPCVLYSWQGGSEGGNSLADILLGDATPSGRLTDTVAYNIEDYPSNKNHGNDDKNIYEEDIYVGYRYFETFAKDKVMYPFGFGLSYTKFSYEYSAKIQNGAVKVSANVKNIGEYSGKAVVQVYYSAPQGKLGRPQRQLIGYQKTELLGVGEAQSLYIEFDIADMAAYDDIESFAYVLEAGEYVIYAGENVRDANEVLRFEADGQIVEQLRQAMAPVEPFERMVPLYNGNGFEVAYKPAVLRQYDTENRIKEHITKQTPPTGNKGIMLSDVADGKHTMSEFVEQLTVEELSYLVKGEGMNSPKVTAGTGGAFGGVTDGLLSYGIPIVCVTDGPSGIRMDSGEKATLVPNGTCLACTWNTPLVRELHAYIGIELRAHEIDILLAPGINIHRHPLCGRNFEYFSEDPYLAGTMAASCTRGLDDVGVMGTIKHFACNSQEHKRKTTEAVVSERALREIYLKPFEIAVKQGKATAIMTSYNKINGRHACVDYDLCTSILRDEWGYSGLVMTDWWTHLDDTPGRFNLKIMVEAQNDLYMVTPSSENDENNIVQSVKDGTLDITFLRQCAANLLNFMLTSPAMNRKIKAYESIDISQYKTQTAEHTVKIGDAYDFGAAEVLHLKFKTVGSELAQYIINVFDGDKYLSCVLVKGTGDDEATATVKLPKNENKIRFEYSKAFEYIIATGFKRT